MNRGARVIGIGLGATGLGVQCELPHNSTESRLGEMRFQVREERDVEGVAEVLGRLIVLRLETSFAVLKKRARFKELEALQIPNRFGCVRAQASVGVDFPFDEGALDTDPPSGFA